MLKDWVHHLKTFFYPEQCPDCGNLLKFGEEEICLICEVNLPTLPYSFFDGNPVEQRFYNNTPINGGNAYLSFIEGGKAQKYIHSFKYKGRTKLAEILGEKAANHALKQNPGYRPDIIVPVPLHFTRERKRGYNQCYFIAKGMAEIWNCPIAKNVSRKKATVSQTKKGRYDRFLNTDGVFSVEDDSEIRNKNILVIDDVITTGSTLNAFCKELNCYQPNSIVVYTLAMKT